MAKPSPPYQVPERVSEVYRTPRAYATTQQGRDSYLARPPPVHETLSDARSWSRQTEDALDAYKQRNEKHRTNIDQFIGFGDHHSNGRAGNNQTSHEIDEKMPIEVAEYRLDSAKIAVPNYSRGIQLSKLSEKSASNYYTTYIETTQLEPEMEEELGTHQGPPQNHRMTKMIVKEDIEFFTALLEGHDPPTTAAETQTFVHDEAETHRHSQETREREADLRRREEAQAAKADADFFMMLMQKE